MSTASNIRPHSAEGAVIPVIGQSRYSHLAQCPSEREVRHQMIATGAYRRAEERGFTAGHELEDWLTAELEVDTRATVNTR